MTAERIQLFYERHNYEKDNTEITILGINNFIPRDCFYGHTKLKKVIIEEGVEVIQANAFRDCFELEDIKLPQSLKEIHFRAFDCCYQIKEITLPIKNITRLEKYCFGEPKKSFGIHFNTIHLGEVESVLDLNKHENILKDYQRTCYQDIEIFNGYKILMQHTFPSPYKRTNGYKVIKDKDKNINPITSIYSCDNIHYDIPIILSTLDGDTYPIFEWGKCLNISDGFTKKVKETYPIFNNEKDKWSYVFDWEDKPTKVFCINSYIQKLLSREINIEEPILIVWDELLI